MKKTQKIYRNKKKHRKTFRRGKKIGGLVGASENVEEKVKKIEKLIIIASNVNQYKEPIKLLIELTKPGKISCKLNKYRIFTKDEICELDKTNSYDKAYLLYDFIKKKMDEKKIDINEWIKEFDSKMDATKLSIELKKKKERLKESEKQGFSEQTLNSYLIQKIKHIEIKNLDYQEKLIYATSKINSEWNGLFLNKVHMYELLNKDPTYYLETTNENPELGLERIILDTQEQKEEDPGTLSKKYKFTKYPFRTWILESGTGGGRTIESYKKRNRTIFKEVLEYFKEENPNNKKLVDDFIKQLKMELEKEPITEDQFTKEVAEIIEWEKTEEKTKYNQLFNDKYNNTSWNIKLTELKMKSNNKQKE